MEDYRMIKSEGATNSYAMPWLPDKSIVESNGRVVCAAVRNKSGLIVAGARHLDSIMRAQIEAMGKSPKDFSDPDDQGFIDQWGQFLSREEAWLVAEKRGQVIRRCGGDGERLYSENLY